MTLSMDEAQRIIDGTVEKAKELNCTLNVAICDAGGRLLAFNRMDGAFWAGGYGAQGKAMSAAAFGVLSSELAETAFSPLMHGIEAAEGGHMAFSGGGVPIYRDDVLIGAIGTGGAAGGLDEVCSLAGVAKL